MIQWGQTYRKDRYLLGGGVFWAFSLFWAKKPIGTSAARVGFACGYGGSVESFSRSIWLDSDIHCCGGQKHKWVQKWMEPGSLVWWYGSSLRLQHFQTGDCWSQDTTAAWRIFLDLPFFMYSFLRLFLVTVESYWWATSALGGCISQLLPLAWVKHFMLKLHWAENTHTFS